MSRPVKRSPIFRFRLYVAGDSQNSTQAISNLDALCREFLAERYEIELVDVFREPKRALVDGILMTPTLMKLGPAPARRIIGTLGQKLPLIQALGLENLTP